MSESTQPDRGFAETVVKEAVGAGMESSMRETILEAVEEAGGPSDSGRRLPGLVGSMGLGVGLGYLLGRRAETPLEFDPDRLPIGESERIETVTERVEPTQTADESNGTGDENGGNRRWLRRALAILAVLGVAALIRRRLRSDDEDAWEPIEEFDVGGEETDEAGAEGTAHEAEAEETAGETVSDAESTDESAADEPIDTENTEAPAEASADDEDAS